MAIIHDIHQDIYGNFPLYRVPKLPWQGVANFGSDKSRFIYANIDLGFEMEGDPRVAKEWTVYFNMTQPLTIKENELILPEQWSMETINPDDLTILKARINGCDYLIRLLQTDTFTFILHFFKFNQDGEPVELGYLHMSSY